MTDLEKIKDDYRSFDNEQIKKIAKYESRGLKQNVVPILIEEIVKRKINPSLIEWIHAERRVLSKVELEVLKSKVKKLACILCKKSRDLRGYHFETKTGIMVNSYTTEYRFIVCKGCGDQKRNKSTVHSLALGWISPVSFISYPFLLAKKVNIYLKEEIISDRIIENFIKGNIGKITLANESTEILKKLVKDYNSLHMSSMTN